MLTPIFFHHIKGIDIFRISHANFFFKKRVLNQICGFFQHFLALFDTFTTRYSHSDMKLKFSDQFQSIKYFILNFFLKMN